MQEFLTLLKGNQETSHIIAFMFFTIFGMVWVKLIRYNIKKKKLLLNRKSVRLNFNFKIWLNDNLIDFVSAFFTSYLIFIFFPDIMSWVNKLNPDLPVFSDKMFYGLLLGIFFQYLLHKVMNKVYIDKGTFELQGIADELPDDDDEQE